VAEVCRFEFAEGISKGLIEEQIAAAILSAECIFGQACVRLHAGYAVSDGKAVIDVSSNVGEYVAQVFTGLMTRQIGEKNFTVEWIKEKGEE